MNKCLDERNALALQNKLDNLVDSILKERASYHFYPGIVRDLKRETEKISRQLSISYFLPELKWNSHLYSLLRFKPKMINFQKKWDLSEYSIKSKRST